jgi:hypothetical protein
MLHSNTAGMAKAKGIDAHNIAAICTNTCAENLFPGSYSLTQPYAMPCHPVFVKELHMYAHVYVHCLQPAQASLK